MTTTSTTTELTVEQIRRARAQLDALRRRATARAEAREDDVDDLRSEVDPDEAVLDVDLVVTTRLAGGASAALEAVDKALERLDDGCYGQCVDCAIAIGLERLRAVPTAARCVDCQAAAERD